jgi:3-oxoacyl-[acyl-carrier protein] reductase
MRTTASTHSVPSEMDLGLEGRSAVVTGASAGIGRSVALRLAEEGVRVVAVARRPDLLASLAREVESGGGELHPVSADITDLAAAELVVATAERAVGRIDILVNNAGGSRPTEWDAPDEAWLEAMELNFHAHRRLTQRVLPGMRAAGWGRIVSVTGSNEPRGVNAAAPAKAALHMWAKGLSRMVAADGVTVNCVPPGRIHSEQMDERLLPTPELQVAFAAANIPAGRLGEPEELADVVVFLASDRARYVTGVVVDVDGGMRMSAF